MMKQRARYLLPAYGLVVAVALLAGPGLPASFLSNASAKQMPGAPAPGVLVEEARLQTLETEHVFSGRTEAISRVSLIARVGGFLKPLKFSEGALVKKGEPLFEIERGPYKFAVDQANANVQSAQAKVDLAQLEYDRKKLLVEKDSISVSELDVARASLKEARAALSLREAELALRELDLSYTTISAPMDGKVGTSAFKSGAYVTASSGELATITSLDPIRVSIPVTQGMISRLQLQNTEELNNYQIQLRLTDRSVYSEEGEMDYLSAQANPETDSVDARIVFPNPDHRLFDRQLVDVLISRKNAPKQLIVSQAAMLLDQDGTYVLKVDAEGIVEKRPVAVGEQRRGLVIIKSGLSEGDQVIVAGSQKARPGSKVTAKVVGQ